MTKLELAERIAHEVGITKKAAAKILDVFVDIIHAALQGETKKIRVSNLGTFKATQMPARNGVHPRTLEKITIPSMVLPRFTPSKTLRESVRTTE
jgi:DNA-binding protein HU-beta